jgi:hypothetical protein
MKSLFKRWAIPFLLALGGLALAGVAPAQERPGDKGETPEAKKLRGRSTAPMAGQMDSAVTLDAMLSKSDASAFSQSRGATIEGWVIQTEKEEDGDFHVVLAANKGETDTKKWVIVEVPTAWQKKSVTMSEHALRDMVGKKIKVTGWLYWEPDAEQPDPRGTRWELHPVTAITEAK